MVRVSGLTVWSGLMPSASHILGCWTGVRMGVGSRVGLVVGRMDELAVGVVVLGDVPPVAGISLQAWLATR